MKLDKLLNNRLTLYVVGGLAILNLIGYIATENTEGALAMIVIGILTAKFSKNMIVVFGTSLIATSLLVGIQHLSSGSQENIREGMASDGSRSFLPKPANIPIRPKLSLGVAGAKTDESESDESKRYERVAGNVEAQQLMEINEAEGGGTEATYNLIQESKEAGEKTISQLDREVADETFQGGRSSHADLLEKAHDSLDELMGGSGVGQGGVDHRPALEESKVKVLEAMQNLGPAMDSANQIVDKLNSNPNMSRLVGSIADMADAITKRVKETKSKRGGAAAAEEQEI